MLYRISLVFAIIVFHSREAVEAAPAVVDIHQFLPPMPGYIPVYIRPGDTPLEEINMELAEAFRSYALKQARLNSIQGRARNVLTAEENKKLDEESKKPHGSKIEGSFGLDDFDLEDGADGSTGTTHQPGKPLQHIQKIKPRT